MPEADQPLMYFGLAPWFHLITAPEDYTEEAAFYTKILREHAQRPLKTVLELGAGGGNNASHMKRDFQMTLTDLSDPMLDLSRRINPECEHIQGDMRTLRLGRTFDAVFVHDAASYLTTEADVRAAIETAFAHCEPGGVAFFAPDHVREHFALAQTTAATTAMAAASVTWSGRMSRLREPQSSRPTMPTFSAKKASLYASSMTVTSEASLAVTTGCVGYPKRGSSHEK